MKKILLLFLFSFSPLLVFSQEILNEENIYELSQLDPNPKYKVDNSIYMSIHSDYKRSKETKKIKGNVVVNFVIEKDGTLSNFKIIKDLGFGTGEELIRVLKKTGKWKQGLKDGKPVRTFFTFVYVLK